MTAMIRHHTTQAHIKAASSVPAFTLRNDPSPEGLEDWLATKMREDAQRPKTKEPRATPRQQQIADLMADGRERTASDVATAVGLSGRSGIESARAALSALHKQGTLALGFICKGQLRISVWRLSQGRPSTAREAIMDALSDGDRLSLAKIVKRSGFLSKNPMASLDTTLRRMLAEGVVTRGKYGSCYEYQLAHVSCKDRIAAAKAEASA